MKLCKNEDCSCGSIEGSECGQYFWAPCPDCDLILRGIYTNLTKEVKKVYKGPQTDKTTYINTIERQILKRILGAEMLNRLLLAKAKEKKQ